MGFFKFLSCYDLWPVLKNSISFHKPLCIPQHIQFVFCHSSEKEDDLQLIINCSGILDIKGRFFLMKNNREGPVGNYSAFVLHFPSLM